MGALLRAIVSQTGIPKGYASKPPAQNLWDIPCKGCGAAAALQLQTHSERSSVMRKQVNTISAGRGTLERNQFRVVLQQLFLAELIADLSRREMHLHGSQPIVIVQIHQSFESGC
jgi:hypothetical protein